MFSIDVDGREYWVTARHILTGAKSKPYGNYPDRTIEVKLSDPAGDRIQWLARKFTVLQPAEDVDVAVLVPSAPILPAEALPSPTASSDGMIFGAECEFLGFGLRGGWRAKWPNRESYFPYIKRCGVSGMDSEANLWILDGINHAGFSGGPVIFGTGGALKIVAVISGYIEEPTEVIRGDKRVVQDAPPDTVNVNTGFILAYDISHAVNLIKKNPIGPIRPAKR